MARTIIFRFRDLIIEENGTVNEHSKLINQFGEVWWGWWMKQYEIVPRSLFQELSNRIEKEGYILAYLFNTGLTKFYSTTIVKILVAPSGKIETPNPEKSPSYYHRGSYPAWFKLRTIDEISFPEGKFIYDSFPTRIEKGEVFTNLLNQRISSLEQLRHIDVTLWCIQTED